MRVGRGRTKEQDNLLLSARSKAYRFRQPTADNGQELPMVVGESGRSTFELIRQRGSLRRSGGMMGWPARSHSITTKKTLE